MAQEGLVSVASRHSAPETMARLLAALDKRDLAVFARIDHAANAAAVGMPLRATEVVLFGNPKGGTVLMQDQQRAGIDLPLKALVWEDADSKVWLSYNAPEWIAARAGLAPASAAAVSAVAKALAAIAEEATKSVQAAAADRFIRHHRAWPFKEGRRFARLCPVVHAGVPAAWIAESSPAMTFATRTGASPSPPTAPPIAEAAICAPTRQLWRRSAFARRGLAVALSCS